MMLLRKQRSLTVRTDKEIDTVEASTHSPKRLAGTLPYFFKGSLAVAACT